MWYTTKKMCQWISPLNRPKLNVPQAWDKEYSTIKVLEAVVKYFQPSSAAQTNTNSTAKSHRVELIYTNMSKQEHKSASFYLRTWRKKADSFLYLPADMDLTLAFSAAQPVCRQVHAGACRQVRFGRVMQTLAKGGEKGNGTWTVTKYPCNNGLL